VEVYQAHSNEIGSAAADANGGGREGNMAIGHIFGSNLFNMAILGIDDIAYTKGPLLANASDGHVISAIAAIAMTAIAAAGVTYRIGRKRLPLAWDSLAILGAYAAATYLLYRRQ
jgi:cation:H+ antiporter